MASPNELCCMDAVTLAQQIRKKGVSPREVINAVLARMEKLEPILHAFCTPTPDLARKQADKIEKVIMAGDPAPERAGRQEVRVLSAGSRRVLASGDLESVYGSCLAGSGEAEVRTARP